MREGHRGGDAGMRKEGGKEICEMRTGRPDVTAKAEVFRTLRAASEWLNCEWYKHKIATAVPRNGTSRNRLWKPNKNTPKRDIDELEDSHTMSAAPASLTFTISYAPLYCPGPGRSAECLMSDSISLLLLLELNLPPFTPGSLGAAHQTPKLVSIPLLEMKSLPFPSGSMKAPLRNTQQSEQ